MNLYTEVNLKVQIYISNFPRLQIAPVLKKLFKVVNILLGISPASEVYNPTFRNSVSVPSSWASRNYSCLLRTMEPTQSSEMSAYTGCNRRNVRDFGRTFLRSNYTDITQNTYIQSSMVTEILVRESVDYFGFYVLYSVCEVILIAFLRFR